MTIDLNLKKLTQVGAVLLLTLFALTPQAISATQSSPKVQAETLTRLIDDGWLEDARDQLLPLIDQHPDDAFLRYELTRVSLGLKDYDLADKQSRKCIDLVGDNVAYQILRGHVLGAMAQRGSRLKALSRAKGCRQAYEKAIKLDPGSVEAREALMMYHMMAPGIAGGKKKIARQQAEAINTIDPLYGHFARAQILQHLDKDSVRAREEYQAAMDEFFDDTTPYYEYAGFLNQQKEKDKAVSYYEMGILKDESPAGALMKLGLMLLSDDRPEQAIDAFERALIADPAKILATVHISKVYLNTKKYQRAQKLLTQVLAENPGFAPALYQEGVLLSKSGKNLPKAEANFRRYLDSRLNNAWQRRTSALYHLAKVMEKQGQFTEAWVLARAASDLEPYNKFLKREADKLEFMGSDD